MCMLSVINQALPILLFTDVGSYYAAGVWLKVLHLMQGKMPNEARAAGGKACLGPICGSYMVELAGSYAWSPFLHADMT